ncbi:DNA-protecting protein DprA [Candidatus Uhrbacteria bacterium]|nr:DNA-protecting protein DprA [Candidatus Uhrbacteria bacterium]
MLTTELQKTDLPFALAAARFPKFGAKRLARLKKAFGNFETVWGAEARDLARAIEHMALAEEFVAARRTIEPAEEVDRLAQTGVSVVWIEEETYPALLREIHDPPPFLFHRGALPKPADVLLSVVGSRHMSRYGAAVLEMFMPELARSGVHIVSGLALGCDGYAHELTVKHRGCTYGIVAGGCDTESITPGQNRALAHAMIAAGGGVISEQPVGTASYPSSFPLRNRLIAGISRATLVIEAAEASGSLITARLALEENRDVLAVPGPINAPMSIGTNRLVRFGAHVVTSAEDILSLLELAPTTPVPARIVEPQNATEAALLPHLNTHGIHVDELVRASRLPTTLVLQTLTAMELREVVVHIGGNHYRLNG